MVNCAIAQLQIDNDEDLSMTPSLDGLSIAVVHEWVAAQAGSERVFEALARTFPTADLYALSYEPGVELDLDNRAVQTTALDRPFFRSHRQLALPLMPLGWRALRASYYDLVITSHHAFASSNRLVAPGGRHLCYVHTPARYLWSPDIDPRGRSQLLRPAQQVLKNIDRYSASRVTAFASNSRTVAARVEAFWGRDSVIIPPPVDVSYFSQVGETSRLQTPYLLTLGRWVAYKRHDFAIEVAGAAGVPIVVAGIGPEEQSLRALADRSQTAVTVVKSPSREEVRALIRGATALLYPGVEDFGIIPVEAQAAGTPVIALAEGGATETVIDGSTGFLVQGLVLDRWLDALRRVDEIDSQSCYQWAQTFSRDSFSTAIKAWVDANV